MDYTAQFLTICGLHLLAVASPGPDFAIVLRQSITFGRRPALWTSVGIGSGILVHITYSLLGIGLLVKSSLLAFTILKIAAAAYLVWIGSKALRSKPKTLESLQPNQALTVAAPSAAKAWVIGFMTNALNPKATLFFLSVFSAVIDPRTPRIIQAGYGLWMSVVTALWFCGVAYFFTQERVRRAFVRLGHWFERTMGVVLIALGVRLAFATAGK
ncbi:MAG TPA: LysE family transporter [Opitutaceae bacterium]|nr:LysE family transporter [Opitutaceae bacterium]